MKAWPLLAISIVQSFLCLAHWFLYRTWIDFWRPMSTTAVDALRIAFIVLSFVFMTATLLGFRSSNPVVRIFYKAAALWMGLANFLFVGAVFAWLVDLLLRSFVPAATRIADRPYIAGTLLVRRNRDRRVWTGECTKYPLTAGYRELSGLPQSWRGRQALLVSDLHLGHVNGLAFARRIAKMVRRLEPRNRLSSRRHV